MQIYKISKIRYFVLTFNEKSFIMIDENETLLFQINNWRFNECL